jgi:putative ABC transport system permease protein
MSRGAVARAVRGGITRRRVQTVVIGLVLLVSTAASVLAVGLLADSRSPFDHAFAAQRGADVTATVDPAAATAAQLDATRHLRQVTAAAGPFAESTVDLLASGPYGGNLVQPGNTLVGRASAGGPVDDVTLQSGHWADGPGQLVLDTTPSPGQTTSMPLGSKITVTDLPGKPTLTVVGEGSSVTGSAYGWVTPGQLARLKVAHAPAASELLYRFRSDATSADIRADVSALTRALPASTVTGTESYLTVKLQEGSNISTFVPFIVAFAVIGLVMSVLIVANVISGAVVSGYRRIGVLKSIGFTPGQVVAAYAGQMTAPAVAGALGGVLLGNLLAVPLLSQTANAFGVGALTIPPWVDVVVPVVMCALVGLAALLPSLRAGRLSAAQAIAAGRAPRTGRGYAAHRVLGKLALPRPVTMGLAAPFARPARTAMTLAAVLLGAIAVTFAVGLSTSLYGVVAALSHDSSEPIQVQVGLGGPGGVRVARGPGGGAHVRVSAKPPAHISTHQPSAAAIERTVTTALARQPGTAHYVGEADVQASVAGLSGQAQVIAFKGNATWAGYEMISGHWYAGRDQAVVGTGFLTATGKSVGDTVTLAYGGRQIPVKIVGQVFDTDSNGVVLLTGWQTLDQASLSPGQYDVGLSPGTSADAYAQSLGGKLGPSYFVNVNSRQSQTLNLMAGLIGTLTLMLAVVAALGVLNTVVLSTRERVHDLGVFKAVGMTPRQTITMVVCWVAGTGLVAGVIAVPVGMAVHRYVLPAMAASADTGLPAGIINAYHGWELVILGLAGLAIAVVGALLPASWAAATRTATALHAE